MSGSVPKILEQGDAPSEFFKNIYTQKIEYKIILPFTYKLVYDMVISKI